MCYLIKHCNSIYMFINYYITTKLTMCFSLQLSVHHHRFRFHVPTGVILNPPYASIFMFHAERFKFNCLHKDMDIMFTCAPVLVSL